LSKISIFCWKFVFCPKFVFLENSFFVENSFFFVENFDFLREFRFLSKYFILHHNISIFLPKKFFCQICYICQCVNCQLNFYYSRLAIIGCQLSRSNIFTGRMLNKLCQVEWSTEEPKIAIQKVIYAKFKIFYFIFFDKKKTKNSAENSITIGSYFSIFFLSK